MCDISGAADRIAVARLAGTVSRHADWKAELSNSELKAAVYELEITKGMQEPAELMAEVGGVMLGARDGIALEEGKARVEAAILVAAGADASRIPYWTQVGARRAAQARRCRSALTSSGLAADRGCRACLGDPSSA